MATTATIYDHMANAATQEAALAELAPSPDTTAQLQSELSSGSKVAIHRLFMWLFAYASKLQQDLFDRFRVEVDELAKDGHYGTRRWFVSRAKRFQLGHVLQFTELDAGYAVDDPAARIVTHAAVVELANRVIVKVAKAAGTGLAKLTPEELVAVNDYFQELRPPVQVSVLTADADRLRIFGQVIVDGQLPLSGVQAEVMYHLGVYLRTLAFGGAVRVTDLKQAMLEAAGVVDVRIDRVEVRTTGPWVLIPRIYHTYAGHAVIDPAFAPTAIMTWPVGLQ